MCIYEKYKAVFVNLGSLISGRLPWEISKNYVGTLSFGVTFF